MIAKYVQTIVFCIGTLSTFAQGWSDSLALVQFQETHASITLLQNKDHHIPLHRLDTQRIAFVPIGLSPKQETIMLEQMRKYTPHIAKTTASDFQARSGIFNGVIAVVTDAQVQSPEVAALHSKIVPLITMVLGEATFVETDLLDHSDAVLYLEKPTDLALAIAAQIPFGGQSAIGRLETDLPGGPAYFVRGYGIQVAPPVRLGYVPPVVMGMDGQLLQDSIAAIVQQGIAAGAFPGAQVLVAKDGQVVYHETFGHHTYEQKRPVRADDLYDFASLTKITSGLAALMKWSGEGRFDVDAPLQRYFPEFEDSNKGMLSFRNMLSHNARLRPWIPYWQATLRSNAKYPWEERWKSDITNDFRFRRKTFKRDSTKNYSVKVTDQLWLHHEYKDKIFEAIRKSPLNEEPGYRYSGLLFYLMPDLVLRLSGMPIERYLKTMFYRPLGAFTLTYNPKRFFPQKRIIPTERDTFFRMTLLHGTVHDEGAAMMDGVSCNAGLFGSANDLAKLMQLYLNQGKYGGERYIPAAAVAEFTRRHYAAADNRRGIGFDKPLIEYDPAASSVAKDASPASFGHSGYTGTFAWADPENGLLYIFFSNRVHPTRNNRKIYELNIRPRIHQVLYDACK